MKSVVFAASLFAATSLTPFTPASAQPALGPEACQPLTSSNLEACCEAENWREIVRTEDFAFCPPLSDDDRERLGQELTEDTGEQTNDLVDGVDDGADDVADDVDDGTGDDTTTGSIGNPGNEPGTAVGGPGREVGGAGEDPSGSGMDDPSENTGSSNDSPDAN